MEEPSIEVISSRKSFRPIAVAKAQGRVLRRRREAAWVGVVIFLSCLAFPWCGEVVGLFGGCYMGVGARGVDSKGERYLM